MTLWSWQRLIWIELFNHFIKIKQYYYVVGDEGDCDNRDESFLNSKNKTQIIIVSTMTLIILARVFIVFAFSAKSQIKYMVTEINNTFNTKSNKSLFKNR